MKEQLYFILMADVIDSRKAQQDILMAHFKKVIALTNRKSKHKIISPITITLGDEFQGVMKDLSSALDVMFEIEEQIIDTKPSFKLRYVLLEGKIETPINSDTAYEMLGSGLTDARSCLSNLKNSNDRFHVNLRNEKKSSALNDAFIGYQGIIDDWKVDKDYEIVKQFLQLKDYKLVADKLNKDRSLMWRRERTAKIKEYTSLKNVIKYIGDCKDV